ncbi:MAG: beta-hydroxyacyl-ACP dehydratase [Planctomycetota bacterium]|jgi:3-hydroxyacyl-[acyl-carrier-protein] dehydratase|nr:beta-hydroxyacyl-ACP dehydratase [Planctomycetota bacterium]
MEHTDYDIAGAIPHRPPFLLLDEVTSITNDTITAAYTPKADDELWSRVYAGHYPGSPVTPGVLLCEMLFQASAVLLHELNKDAPLEGAPVVTRIQNVKFKNIVLPGDRLELSATLTERLANAFFMKGSIRRGGKTILQAEFAVALAPLR